MGLAERLHQKGWSKAEIDHALAHMNLAEKQKSRSRRVFEEATYWFAMFVLGLGIVLIVRYLIPFFDGASRALNWPSSLSYTVMVVLGVVVGLLFAHLLHDIAELEPRHHSLVLFLTTAIVLVSALAVGQYSIPLAATFVSVFILYYSFVWWKRDQ